MSFEEIIDQFPIGWGIDQGHHYTLTMDWDGVEGREFSWIITLEYEVIFLRPTDMDIPDHPDCLKRWIRSSLRTRC